MTTPIESLVRQIHARPRPLVLATTGGGSGAISGLLQVPGASRTVLEAVVPYAASALIDWIGARPEQFCAPRTARAMAMAAWQRARDLTRNVADTDVKQLIGIGCTASLASDRPKRGVHRAFVALQTLSLTATWSLHLESGRRGRREEEDLLTALMLNVIAEACLVDNRLEIALDTAESITKSQCDAPAPWQELLQGLRSAVFQAPPTENQSPTPKLVFPGAFNPLHDAHREMAAIAERRLGLPVLFEISVTNVEKPPLDYEEMQARAGQFGDQRLCFTAAPTFVEKSEIFSGATFIVGADTIARIADPRYYGGSQERCRSAIHSIAAHDCRFLMFARAMDQQVKSLAELGLPEELYGLCEEVPVEEFRREISSTELRKQEGS
jgi:hypothetical protein